jgi:hypothetical protein
MLKRKREKILMKRVVKIEMVFHRRMLINTNKKMNLVFFTYVM